MDNNSGTLGYFCLYYCYQCYTLHRYLLYKNKICIQHILCISRADCSQNYKSILYDIEAVIFEFCLAYFVPIH